jgi:hypothetical protein
MEDQHLELLKMLAERLERLNVDSKWARRASGTRGGVLKAIELTQEGTPPRPEILESLIRKSMDLLAKAAREIPDINQPGEYPHRNG